MGPFVELAKGKKKHGRPNMQGRQGAKLKGRDSRERGPRVQGGVCRGLYYLIFEG